MSLPQLLHEQRQKQLQQMEQRWGHPSSGTGRGRGGRWGRRAEIAVADLMWLLLEAESLIATRTFQELSCK